MTSATDSAACLTSPIPESGPCPDFIANQRGRDGGSSAAADGRTSLPVPHNHDAPSALDATGSASLPKATTIANAPSCQLLTARAVADMLDVCAETVLRWIRNGELPAIRLPGGAVRIVDAELRGWLRSRATPARGVLATTAGAAGCERYPAGYD
jgi:excisionase family DNA binding protein